MFDKAHNDNNKTSSNNEDDNDGVASGETDDDNMMAIFDADEQQLEQNVDIAMDRFTVKGSEVQSAK